MAALMLQGTGSDVGKSVLVAGLCRVFANRGLSVRPFKPQNMSNNAAVTADGGEIGRAQALQAMAARVPPSTDMNPVLLKPQSDRTAQLVVSGKVRGAFGARDYQIHRVTLLDEVLAAYARLRAQADIVVIEGAGSPAEINLRARDIANMGFARAAGVPVVLVGDIDRGGVIASLVGTRAVLDAADAAMIRGFIVNKFRGDPRLFGDGFAAIAEATGWRGIGVVPWLPEAARLPAEDAMALDRIGAGGGGSSSPSPCCRASPISTMSTRWRRNLPCASSWYRRARPCRAIPRSSSCRAARRPSPTSLFSARRAGTSIFAPMSGAAAMCWGCAAATRCSAAASPIRSASKARPVKRRGSACCRSKPSWPRPSTSG